MFNNSYSIARIATVTLVILTACFFVAFAFVDFQRSKEHLVRDEQLNVQHESQLLALALAPYLYQQDYQGIESLLRETFKTTSTIQAVSIIRNVTGQAIYAVDRDTFALSLSEQPHRTENLFTASAPITSYGTNLGVVTIKASIDSGEQILWRYFMERFILAAVLNLALGVTLWFLFRRYVLRPIREIEEYALAATNDSLFGEERDDETFPSEFRKLSHAIKDMRYRLTARYNELIRSQRITEKAEKKYRSVFENVTDGIFKTRLDGTIITVNPAMARFFGYSTPESFLSAVPNSRALYVDQADREEFMELMLKKELITDYPVRFHDEAGKVGWYKLNCRMVQYEEGEPYLLGLIENMTERFLTDKALRKSEAKYRALVETANDAIFIHKLASENECGKFLEVNESACKRLHYTPEELARMTPWDLDAPQFRENLPEIHMKLIEHGSAIFETAHTTKEGEFIPVEVSTKLIAVNDERYVVSIARDITERKKAEEALRKSEADLKQRLDLMLYSEDKIGFAELNHILGTPVIQSLIDTFVKLTGASIGVVDIKGRCLVTAGWQDICTHFHRAVPESERNCIQSDTVLTQSTKRGDYLIYKCKNNMWDVATPLYIEDKHVANIFIGQFFFDDEVVLVEDFEGQADEYGFHREAYLTALEKVPRFSHDKVDKMMDFMVKLADVISNLGYGNLKLSKALWDQKRGEKALRESESRYRMLFENLPLGVAVMDRDMHIISLNSSMRTWSQEVDLTTNPQCFRTYFQPPRGKPCDNCPVVATLKDGQVNTGVIQVFTAAGEKYARIVACPIFDADGKVAGVIEIAEDVTVMRRVGQAARETEKMTAVGRLARGIAHDFNNILGSIANMAEFTRRELPDESDAREDLNSIINSADMGKELVDQLLTFCRSGNDMRTIFSPADATQEILRLQEHALLREVELEITVDDEGEKIEADFSQFQQVLFNLCSNAVDAMRECPGTLSVHLEIDEVTEKNIPHPSLSVGRYAVLEIRDTGPGITQENLKLIFDPFFTTKAKGHGTGLGLSVVHGVATRHHGAVTVESSPENGGTVFKVFFPVSNHKIVH